MATMFCYLFFYTGRQTFGFAIPGIEDELGLSKSTLGWASAALLWSYALGQAINGNLGDMFGGRRMMSLGAILSCGLNWCMSVGPDISDHESHSSAFCSVTLFCHYAAEGFC